MSASTYFFTVITLWALICASFCYALSDSLDPNKAYVCRSIVTGWWKDDDIFVYIKYLFQQDGLGCRLMRSAAIEVEGGRRPCTYWLESRSGASQGAIVVTVFLLEIFFPGKMGHLVRIFGCRPTHWSCDEIGPWCYGHGATVWGELWLRGSGAYGRRKTTTTSMYLLTEK